jgi:hypothetical protein
MVVSFFFFSSPIFFFLIICSFLHSLVFFLFNVKAMASLFGGDTYGLIRQARQQVGSAVLFFLSVSCVVLCPPAAQQVIDRTVHAL